MKLFRRCLVLPGPGNSVTYVTYSRSATLDAFPRRMALGEMNFSLGQKVGLTSRTPRESAACAIVLSPMAAIGVIIVRIIIGIRIIVGIRVRVIIGGGPATTFCTDHPILRKRDQAN